MIENLPASQTCRRIASATLLMASVAAAAGCGPNAAPTDRSDSTRTEQKREEKDKTDPPLPEAAAASATDRISEKQLHERLKRNNPQYNGNAQIAESDGEIIAVSLRGTNVTDLRPLAGLKLKSLDLFQTQVSDLAPLRGMPLVELMADETAVSDIGPLEGMPLKTLWLNGTKVTDLSPLEGLPIRQLNLFGTQVVDITVLQSLPLNTLWLRNVPLKDFSPLDGLFLESLDVQGTSFGDSDLAFIKGMPVKRLNIAETKVTDLTALQNLRLTRLIFTPSRIKQGLADVRSMDSLQELDVTFREPKRLTPAEFWKRHGAGEFDRPKE